MRHGDESKRTGWNSKKLDLSDLLSVPSQAMPSSGSRRKQEIYILNGLNQRGSGIEGFPTWRSGKELACIGGDKGSIRNINNLRYADDTTLMAESEEGTKKPLDESERGE